MPKRTLEDLAASELAGRKVLVRADFNVPLADDGSITDDTRIRSTLPTLERLARDGARTLLLSHLGRPKGEPDPRYSLAPVARRLDELLDAPVTFCPTVTGPEVDAAVEALEPGGFLLLENTRFHPGETANDPDLSREFARYADVYVNDAFGSAHRAHASTHGAAEAVRAAGGPAVAGFLLERELRFLGQALEDPARPFVAVMGGAKISGKIDVIDALLPRVDHLLIGGAMANTFFLALGLDMGRSLVEEDRVEMARDLMERAGEQLVLPVDCVVAPEIGDAVATRVVQRTEVGGDDLVGDIGPESVAAFAETLSGAGTILWNGPMGVFEARPFAGGTLGVAEAIAAATDGGAVSIVGGGDSAAAAEAAGVAHRMTHISTGGGASLEFLSGAELPGVAILSDREGS